MGVLGHFTICKIHHIIFSVYTIEYASLFTRNKRRESGFICAFTKLEQKCSKNWDFTINICFPEGFYIHAILLFKENIEIPQILKKNNQPYKNQLGAYLKLFENLLIDEIKNKGGVNVNVTGERVRARNFESEWFYVDLQVMKNAFKQFYKDYNYDFIRPMLKFK